MILWRGSGRLPGTGIEPTSHSAWKNDRVRFGSATVRCGQCLLIAVTIVVAAGCVPFWGDSDGYGPWLGSLVGPIAIFDGEVIETGSVDVNLRGEDGAVLSVESYPTVAMDDVEVLAGFAANLYKQELYDRFSTMAAASTPIEILHDDAVKFKSGKRYRIFLWHFGSSTDMDFYVGFAWDLEKDRPADGQSAKGWNADLKTLRSAGLIAGSGADALVEIAEAMSATSPSDRQRDIIVKLLGESMVPGTVGSTPVTAAP